MPTEPPSPSPEVMTADEVASFRRLDTSGRTRPVDAPTRYRKRGLLRGVMLGRSVRCLLTDVLAFTRNKAQEEPLW